MVELVPAPSQTPSPLPSETPTPLPPEPTATPTASPSPSSTPTPSPPADCLSVPGSLEEATLITTHIAYSLRFNIYLPPCYAEHVEERYPVLYLFHGLLADETQWLRIGAADAMDRLIGGGEIPPFIIVMPHDPSWRRPPEYRFDDAITEDLIPAIEENYRVAADRSQRVVGGLSRGSAWAFHLGLTRPDLFGAIGAHSMVVFGGDWTEVDGWLASLPRPGLPRLYIDITVNDTAFWMARQLEVALMDAAIAHEFHLNDGHHDEEYWSANVEAYLRWYAAGWAAEP